MTECFVGFDTSNYTTSVAVCSANGEVVANLKMPLSVREGERGLRQSDAVFAHTKNLPVLLEQLGGVLREERLHPIGVGVSTRPRDAEGSYMPCFLAGKSAAYAFGAAANLPVREFAHQNGHVMAALYSCGKQESLRAQPFLAFHVSGGTTEALFARPEERGFSLTLVGETDDINAGQLIDRIGVAMGLSFPCGKEMEALASAYQGKIHRHPVCVRDTRCSLSGAENIAMKLWRESGDGQAVAAFVFDFVCRTLLKMGEQLEEQYGKLPMVFAGGVMSNEWMRKRLSSAFDASFSEPAFSADNAAGIALLAREALLQN